MLPNSAIFFLAFRTTLPPARCILPLACIDALAMERGRPDDECPFSSVILPCSRRVPHCMGKPKSQPDVYRSVHLTSQSRVEAHLLHFWRNEIQSFLCRVPLHAVGPGYWAIPTRTTAGQRINRLVSHVYSERDDAVRKAADEIICPPEQVLLAVRGSHRIALRH